MSMCVMIWTCLAEKVAVVCHLAICRVSFPTHLRTLCLRTLQQTTCKKKNGSHAEDKSWHIHYSRVGKALSLILMPSSLFSTTTTREETPLTEFFLIEMSRFLLIDPPHVLELD